MRGKRLITSPGSNHRNHAKLLPQELSDTRWGNGVGEGIGCRQRELKGQPANLHVAGQTTLEKARSSMIGWLGTVLALAGAPRRLRLNPLEL